MYHVFKAGQQCVRARAGVGGESTERLPRHSNVDANLTHARVLPTVCVAISSSLTDLRGVVLFPVSARAILLPRAALAPACGRRAHRRRNPFRWPRWMACWQRATAAECQFLQTLYNHVSPRVLTAAALYPCASKKRAYRKYPWPDSKSILASVQRLSMRRPVAWIPFSLQHLWKIAPSPSEPIRKRKSHQCFCLFFRFTWEIWSFWD